MDVRFESALQMKAVSPHLTGTEVACECRYYDQMHMIHDFQQLSAETPSGLLYQLSRLATTMPAQMFVTSALPSNRFHPCRLFGSWVFSQNNPPEGSGKDTKLPISRQRLCAEDLFGKSICCSRLIAFSKSV